MYEMNAENLIGNTPLVRLRKIEEKYGLCARLYAKVEGVSVGGSIKDRVAQAIINDAEQSGKLKKGGTVIEATSGNTGVGLALVCACRGYKAVIVMPETMSVERRKLILAYGAEIVLTAGEKGMQGAVEKAEEICKNTPNSIIAGQFENPANAKAHYDTTAPEIWEALQGQVDMLVAGVGTGGTITGIGKYLKEKNPQVEIVAVEPAKSPLLSKGVAGAHGVQGIGANFIPKILDRTVYSKIVTATDEDAYAFAKEVCKEEGLFVGISSGAALFCAIEQAKLPQNAHKKIVVVFPDNGDRYLSVL